MTEIAKRSPAAFAVTCVTVDFAGWTSPVPPRLMRKPVVPVTCEGSPVFMIAALMSSTLQDGCACRVSAATPATCGEAIEVPEIVAAPLPVPTPVETVDTPGAEMFGFRPLSPVRGPPDEKLAKPLKLSFVIDAGRHRRRLAVGRPEPASVRGGGRSAGHGRPGTGS